MSNNSLPNVWLWREPDKRWLNKILDHIKASAPSDNDIILLHCEDINDFDSSIPLTNFLFNLSVRFNLFENERTMFVNLKDMISSIELCLGRRKKDNKTPETDKSDEEIINFYSNYVSCFKPQKVHDDESVQILKTFLKQNNCIDACQLLDTCLNFKSNNAIVKYIDDCRYLILGTPNSLVLKQLIGIISVKGLLRVSVETPLDISLHGSPINQASEKIKVTEELIELEDIPVHAEKESSLGSATEEYVEDTILAFLSLLVNSRNELALSKAMVSPVIDLSHEAFTALKHLSVEKDMPMCQVAISYVTRIRLGGKGYAPPGDCPMLPHLKGLELFVDTLNQLQTIIEEDSQPNSAIKRLINVLKRKLLKCGSDKLKISSVEAATENLQSVLLTVMKLKSRISSSTSQICQEALDVLYHFVNFLSSAHFTYDPERILAKKHAERTPLNLPPLLGYFRSPEDESSCDTKSSLNEDSALSRSSMVQHPAFPSYFHHSESSDISTSCVNSSTPSKITFKGCLKEKDKSESKVKFAVPSSENSQDTVLPVKNRKRSILGEITNENYMKSKDVSSSKKDVKRPRKILGDNAKENVNRSSNKKQTKKETKVVGKKFKQIQGQGKITNFFIKGNS